MGRLMLKTMSNGLKCEADFKSKICFRHGGYHHLESRLDCVFGR